MAWATEVGAGRKSGEDDYADESPCVASRCVALDHRRALDVHTHRAVIEHGGHPHTWHQTIAVSISNGVFTYAPEQAL